MAALFVGVAPIAVQQAHFHTVDSLFLACNTAALLAVQRVLDRPSHMGLWLCGLLIGLASSVRHMGLMLLPVVALCYWLRGDWRGTWGDRLRLLVEPWPTACAACATVLILQPYLLTAPELLQRTSAGTDFYYAAQVARGELLPIWSLADYHTTSYLYHWTSLWPDAVGWPVALCFFLGVIYAAVRIERRELPLLLWAGIYFALVGGFHTKHMRYVLPLLPVLALWAAHALVALYRRFPGGLVAALIAAVVGYGALYGVAFASIYAREDARVSAARWIERHVPPGSTICVERGAFTLSGLIDDHTYSPVHLELNSFFDQQGYLTCGAVADRLERRLYGCDYIVFTDVNRLRSFTHVPDLFPAVASFYNELAAGRLGFDLVGHFKQYPSLFGVEFRDDGAEVSFLSYDHPAVFVLRRDVRLPAAIAGWRQSLLGDPHCVDPKMMGLAAHLKVGGFQQVAERISSVAQGHPDALLLQLIAAYAQEQVGLPADAALRAYRSGYYRRRFIHGVPGAAAMSFAKLDLAALSLLALDDGLKLYEANAPTYTPGERQAMAHSYVVAGDTLAARGHLAHAQHAWIKAMGVDLPVNAVVERRLRLLRAKSGIQE